MASMCRRIGEQGQSGVLRLNKRGMAEPIYKVICAILTKNKALVRKIAARTVRGSAKKNPLARTAAQSLTTHQLFRACGDAAT